MNRVGLGLLLIAVAIGFLFFVLTPVMGDVPFVMNVLQSWYCDAGDTLSAERYVTRDYDGTGYSADFRCTRPNETSYDVNGRAFLIGGGGFTGLLLVGIVVLVGPFRLITGLIDEDDGDSESTLRRTRSTPGMQVSTNSGLTVRLRELQEALDAGLITREEYEAKRAEIMQEH